MDSVYRFESMAWMLLVVAFELRSDSFGRMTTPARSISSRAMALIKSCDT
jgi:hypothetical protein